MSNWIPAVLFIFTIGLLILFRSAKKKPPGKGTEAAEIFPEETSKEPVAAPEPEATETGAVQEAVASAAGTGQDEQKGVEDAEFLETAAGEEFVELSLDSEETAAEAESGGEEFIELSLDMEEKSGGDSEAVALDAEEGDEDSEVIPALAGTTETISTLAGEETPAELTRKLDYYFGDKEETAPESVAESAEEEIVLEEIAAEPLPEESGIEPEPEPAGFTLRSYQAALQSLESDLRRELRNVIAEKATDQRFVLENKLQSVCEKLAGIEDNFTRQEGLIAAAEKMLADVHDQALQLDLPGIDIEEAESRLHLGRYEQVESMLAEAVLQLDQGSELVAAVYYLCGQLAEERLDYESAFEDYRNAAAARSNNADYLLAAARVSRILGNDGDAQTWLENIVRQGLEQGEQTLVQAAAQHELARVCVRAGQKEKAGALFKRALEIREDILGKEHPDLALLMHDYGALFESNGMYEQAEELYTSALEIMEKRLGSSHPGLGATLNKLAGLYEEMEHNEKALPLYERALAIKERVLGPDHYDVGTILNSRADLLRRQGRLEQAEPMFKRALGIAEKELGKDHPNLTVVLNNLAELYSQMGREEEADRYRERAFSLFEMPGLSGDFVEMEKDQVAVDDSKNTTVAGK
ncbi:MAG: tetratricopeptide repeat protein [Desulfobulbaceae bacterium]|nr:tetratricopeptide repeat protein [Desulfobulbaceae bacterium]